jgi:integrase
MATVYKRGGKGNRGGWWYFAWFDHTGRRRTQCARTTDKATAERMAAKRESDAALRRAGVIDATQERFATEALRPVAQHVADFKAHLQARQNTAKHVALTIRHVEAIISARGGAAAVKTIRDLTGADVMQALDAIRLAGNRRVKDDQRRVPLGPRTCNAVLRSIKSFTRWLWLEKRAPDDPLNGLRAFNEETDRRHSRRELTVDEIAWLLPVVESRTIEGHKLAGPDRAMLYRLALGTGLRAAELRSLTAESFDLDAEPATVTVAAAYSKRRREDSQPLRADLAELVRGWLAGRPRAVRSVRLFAAMPRNTARMLRADLKAARAAWIEQAGKDEGERERRERSDFLAYRNAAGEVADFHSTRHTFISGIVAGGASVKVAQELARHSTSRLTVDRYAHARLHDLQGALDALPSCNGRESPDTERGTLRATGTDSATGSAQPPVQRRAQRAKREMMPAGANRCASNNAAAAKSDSPDDPQTEPPGEVVPFNAMTDEQRRRWESNPRWRICNQSTTRGILEGNCEFRVGRITIALRPRFGTHHRRVAIAPRCHSPRNACPCRGLRCPRAPWRAVTMP